MVLAAFNNSLVFFRLELSDVHKETTENVRVTVIPFYMGYRENQNTNVYWVSPQISIGR